MPHYEYECPICYYPFGIICKLRDYDKQQRCPICGGIADRVMSRTSFMLKGTCWEKDGYEHKRKDSDKTDTDKA